LNNKLDTKDLAPVIAIDGLSATGKGTIAKLLAQKLRWGYIDSGKLYRIYCWSLQQPKAIAFEDLNIVFDNAAVLVDGMDITAELLTETIALQTSHLSKDKTVRQKVNQCLHNLRKPPGIVVDGRDIGSIVFPDAKCKFFFTANVEVRANRRLQQLQAHGNCNLAQIIQGLNERDKNDSHTIDSPLHKTKKTIIIDTSNLTIESVLNKLWLLVSSQTKAPLIN